MEKQLVLTGLQTELWKTNCTSVWLVCCLEGPNDEACEEVHSDF